MTPTHLTIAAVAALAAAGAARKRRGDPNVNAWEDLSYQADSPHDGLEEYYPQTARGELEMYRGERVFWAGRGYRKIGYAGPTDGRMVPVDARYVVPMPGNIFYSDKFSALVAAVRAGDEPVVRPGYGHFTLVDRADIEESREYAGEDMGEPYEDDDLGALTAQIRDGNHRTFAALVAGAPYVWVLLSDSDQQSIFSPPDYDKRRMDKLYRAIRKAQREAGAPLLTRPRKPRGRKKAAAQLQVAQAQYDRLKAEEERLAGNLLRRYHAGHEYPQPLSEMLERPGLFLRLRMRQAIKAGDEALLDRFFDDPDRAEKDRVSAQRVALVSRLYDLRKAAGVKE